MIKPIELRKVIAAALKTVHPRVYYERAPDKAQYPYLVWELPDSINDGYRERWRLEIDGWDAPANGDTVALETLMDKVNSAIDEMVELKNLVVVVRLQNRLSLQDDDPSIRRRKYVYAVRTFG